MLERMKEIVTVGGLTLLAVMLFVLLAAYCWQCLPREALRRKRIWELAFLAAFVGCFWHLGATKSTNRTDSAGAPFGALLMSGSPMGTDAPVDATPDPVRASGISTMTTTGWSVRTQVLLTAHPVRLFPPRAIRLSCKRGDFEMV